MSPPKLRILFVDDEPRVLSGIQRLLRKDSARWEMVFALGGAQGLEELHRERFTVVVSDYRMPGVDGVALLNAAADTCPDTARIMLSGDAEASGIGLRVPALQELLVKPCDTATLRSAIERGIRTAHEHDAGTVRPRPAATRGRSESSQRLSTAPPSPAPRSRRSTTK